MKSSLLATKLMIPPLRPNLVKRPRLLDRFTGVPHLKLVLITAPAGFGKTTLVTSWLYEEKERAPNHHLTWFSLAESDNDPVQFFTYFVAALQTAVPHIGSASQALLNSPQPSRAPALLTPLLNELTAAEQKITLVLDDYHFINNQTIHEALSFLLDQQPPTLQLVLLSRSQPPLPLSRLRARGQLLEIGASDLRFSTTEAQEFLQNTMQRQVSMNHVQNLEARTEGWITGLQLAALASDQSNQLPHSFSGRHHYVLDYLVDEVLSHQPELVREFLLQTAVCERLSAELCDAVTQIQTWKLEQPHELSLSSQSLLAYLEAANLFIIPLDDERTWFRYHHLFVEFLQTRLHTKKSASDIAALHLRAAIWQQQNEFYAEAITHAFAAQAYDLAAELIMKTADQLWTRGSLNTLQTWLEKLPEETLTAQPRTAVYLAWVLFFTGQMSPDGEAQFAQAETLLNSIENQPEKLAPETEGMLLAVRTALASMQNAPEQTIQLAQKALALLPDEKFLWRSVVGISLAYAYQFTGQLTAAIETFGNAARQARTGGNLSGALFAYGRWAALLRQQAKLHEAEQVYQEALRAAAQVEGQTLPICGQIYLGLGELAYEWNALGDAETFLKRGISQFQAGGFPTIDAQFLLARLYVNQSRHAEADALAEQAAELLNHNEDPRLNRGTALAAQASYWLLAGHITAVKTWAAQTQLPRQQPNPWQEAELLTWVRLQLSGGTTETVSAVLTPLYEMAAGHGRVSSQIEIRLLQAITLQLSGKTEAALAYLQEALALAQPGGFRRLFLDEGARCHALLKAGYQLWKAAETVDTAVLSLVESLLLAFNETLAEEPTAGQSLVEPLSSRELEILRLIRDGRSNQQIADELVVALSTIKWHINNIYGKLGVRTRAQAIIRARELSI